MRPSGSNWLDAYHRPACNRSVEDSTQSHDPSEPQGVIHLHKIRVGLGNIGDCKAGEISERHILFIHAA